MFKGGAGAAGQLKNALSFMNQVSSALGGSGSIMDKISQLAKNAPATLSSFGIRADHPILQGISMGHNLVMQINDGYEKIRNFDFKNVNNLTKLASDLTGINFLSISNHLTQAEYTVGLVKEMIKSNIPDSFGFFKDIIKDNPYKAKVIKEVYPTAVEYQDLRSIRSMVDTVGSRQFTFHTSQDNLSGNFTNILSKNWDKNKERLDFTTNKKFIEIKDTLKTVNGDNWIYQKRNNELTINVKDYLYSSERFKEIFQKGVVNSNQVKIPVDSTTNQDILDEIAGNDITKKDDEKFLASMGIGSYSTVTRAIKDHFPRLLIDSIYITV